LKAPVISARRAVLDARDVILADERQERAVIERHVSRRAGGAAAFHTKKMATIKPMTTHGSHFLPRSARQRASRPRRTTRRWFGWAPLIFRAWGHE
jgi:hypothetical protein